MYIDSGKLILMPTKQAQNLEVVKTPEKFTDRELSRALRDAIMAEEGAIKQYESAVDATDNDKVKETLQSIANEEKIHVGEIQKLLKDLEPDEEEHLEEGEKEVTSSNKTIIKIADEEIAESPLSINTIASFMNLCDQWESQGQIMIEVVNCKRMLEILKSRFEEDFKKVNRKG